MFIERAWNESLHPREAGKFTAKSAGDKGNSSFDGKRGTGYGTKGGDGGVKELQTALNKLGLTDAAGKPLELDGKLGPKTTAAIKKAQRKLGIKADGIVTPALLSFLKKASTKNGERATPTPAKKVATPAKKAATPAKKVSSSLAAARATAAKKAAPAKKAVAPKKVSSGLAAARATAAKKNGRS